MTKFNMKKLAIITTHPIQYNAPFFKLLTERGKVQLKVFYTWPQAIDGFDDPDFGKQIQWDIPLLEGYDWEAVENVSKKPSSKKWSGIDCPDLIERMKIYQPDAMMVYGWNFKSHFKAMRYFKGRVPVWFFGDSTLLDEQPGLKKILRRIWLTWVYRHISKAFYVGTNNKAYFKAHGLKEEQLVFFPHAVDNERFFDSEEKQYEKKARQKRKELGYRETDIVVLFAGKLEAKKNPLILLEAVCQFNQIEWEQSNSTTQKLNKSTPQQINKSTNKQLNLLFVGNGPLETELKVKSQEFSCIKFLSFQNQSDMPVVYRLGNVFCLPSKGPGETWGLAVNEALACGRPVLVSDKVGCALDLVKEGVNGVRFAWNDREDMMDKVKQVIDIQEGKLLDKVIQSILGWNFAAKCKALEREIEILH
jgi:glycosyltransferase involved in cell wall biosynthesis